MSNYNAAFRELRSRLDDICDEYENTITLLEEDRDVAIQDRDSYERLYEGVLDERNDALRELSALEQESSF